MYADGQRDRFAVSSPDYYSLFDVITQWENDELYESKIFFVSFLCNMNIYKDVYCPYRKMCNADKTVHHIKLFLSK